MLSLLRCCCLIALSALMLPLFALADEDDWAMSAPIPEVLTATRLKQAKTETPASVTIIDAGQIQAWGARTVPEVLRFVPGMFVGASQKESTDTVVYHASMQNIMRRLQVRVDGRSIYKAAIARVVWDDLPLAVEDIARIEIIRGPSSAVYGANAFMATINIITKNPDEALGTRLRYRDGNQGTRDAFASCADLTAQGGYRLSLSSMTNNGFDGPDAKHGNDEWQDDRRNRFANFTWQQTLNAQTQMRLYAGYTDSYADITNNPFAPEQQYRHSHSGFVHSNIDFEFSARHKAQLQMYWQKEWREQERTFSTRAIAIDSNLARLYQLNPQGTMHLIGQLSAAQPDFAAINDYVSTLPSDQQLLITQLKQHDLNATVRGTFDFGYTEERVDVEWQDTLVWSERLRTVSGVSVRRDQASSLTFLGGERVNNTYRVFANAEWRLAQPLVLNAGATYEYDELNQGAFTPRLALNYLLTSSQALRLVYAEAVRSPDMLEQQPQMTAQMSGLSSNYLNLSSAQYFQTQIYANRGLSHEHIRSYELGYFGTFNQGRVEMDIKLYHDELTDLVSGDPTNIDEMLVASDSSMQIQGAEAQARWHLYDRSWLWFTAAYLDVDANIRKKKPYCIETCLSPKHSFNASWFHQGQGWSSTLSYFWMDGFSDNRHLYHRTELQLRKEWTMGHYTPWIGGFWQYQLANEPLGYTTQKYSTDHIYYLQAGLNF